MDKMTIGLILLVVIAAGAIGYIFGSQNSQSLPIILANNTTNDSGDSGPDLITKKTKTNKTNSTSGNKTNSTKPSKNTTPTNESIKIDFK